MTTSLLSGDAMHASALCQVLPPDRGQRYRAVKQNSLRFRVFPETGRSVPAEMRRFRVLAGRRGGLTPPAFPRRNAAVAGFAALMHKI
jgi:hypothetical protein